jgi:hypothetical protein
MFPSHLLPLRLRVAYVLLGLAAMPSLVPAAAPTAPAGRELTTDRPDATESPFTVDAGRLQVELDAAAWTRDRAGGVRTTTWELAPFNLRWGATSDVEFGLFISPHVAVTERSGGMTVRTRGFGDATLRAKSNFWGNDGGDTAFGLIADLKVPTAATGLGNDKAEGALTFPFAFAVGAGWEGAAMTSLACNHLGAGRGYEPVWTNTVTFARDLLPDLGAFFELTSTTGDGRHVATFNLGLTRPLSPGLQLDAGAYIGISKAAPDLTLFFGLARKF